MATLEKLDLGTARLSEAACIAEMSRRWIEQGLPWRYRPHSIAHQIRDSETAVVVSRAAGNVVGFAAMEFHFDTQRAHLVLLAVEPAYRRRGVGVALYRWLEKVALLRGGRVDPARAARRQRGGARLLRASRVSRDRAASRLLRWATRRDQHGPPHRSRLSHGDGGMRLLAAAQIPRAICAVLDRLNLGSRAGPP